MDDFPHFDVEFIILKDYVIELREFILYNLRNKYKKLKHFDCTECDLTELPDFPDTVECQI